MARKSSKSETARKPLSVKTRFDTFKRDDFTCRYCGRKTPTVVLEIDHVVPVVEGGTNDLENLVTSCFDCNRGKGRGILANIPTEEDMEVKAVLLLERERQLREYNEVKRQVREREEEDLSTLRSYFGNHPLNGYYKLPPDSIFLHWLKLFAVEDIIEAIGYAISRVGGKDAPHYMSGILRNKLKDQQEGRGR